MTERTTITCCQLRDGYGAMAGSADAIRPEQSRLMRYAHAVMLPQAARYAAR